MKSSNLSIFLGIALAAALAAPSGAAQPALETLFPYEAQIEVEDSRLSRLPLPPEIVGQCRPDFSDLRVFDAHGQEVPYLVDSGLADPGLVEITQNVLLPILAVERSESRPDDAPPRFSETYRLGVPDEEPMTGRWDLVLGVSASSLVRRVDIAALGPEGESILLVAGGSIFRLHSPRRERMRLELPAFEPDTEALVVTLVGEDGNYLEPVFHLESSRSIDRRRRAEVDLNELTRRSEAGLTIIELERPRGLVPDRLILHTSTPSLHRQVVVWDDGPGGGLDPLGEAVVFRVEALTAVEDLEIPLRVARGDRLRVVTADLDSPPLRDLRFSARLGHPALLVHLTPVEDGPDGILRFGGGRAFRPRYDLAGLVPPQLPITGERVATAERLWDRELLGTAQLGDIEPNPRFDATPALAFAMRPGAEIDRRIFSHRRELSATPSDEGLSRLRLTLEDLAIARADLGDLRIVDEADRQWAYLLEPRAATLRLELDLVSEETEDGHTTYRFRLPSSPAAIKGVIVHTSIPFFDRPFQLWGILEDEERRISQGRLARRIGDPRPMEIAFSTQRLDALELRVENGDDAPLVLDNAMGLFPVPELFFAVPQGHYELILGEPEIGTPKYELERVRSVVLAVASADVESDSLAPNPTFSPGRRLASEKGAQRIFLWAGLVLAVLVLAWLTLRLATTESSP